MSVPRLRQKRSSMSPCCLLSTLPGRTHCPVPRPSFSPAEGTGAQAGAAGPWWSRARAAESGVGRARSVHPEGEPGRDGGTAACLLCRGHQPRGAGSHPAAWNSRIRPRVIPHPSFAYSFAMQPRRRSRRLGTASAPVAMFRLQSGALSHPGLSPELSPSHSLLWLRCCPMPPSSCRAFPGDTAELGGRLPTVWPSLCSFQRGGCGALGRAPSAAGRGRAGSPSFFAAQLRGPRPAGIVWFCPHSR